MSRFANPAATKPWSFRDCACPGRPHERDWLVIRCELGVFEVAELTELSGAGRLRRLIVSWNLLDDDGQLAPITDEYLTRLYTDEFEALDAWILRNIRVTAIPKARGARFRNGLRAVASLFTRTSRARA